MRALLQLAEATFNQAGPFESCICKLASDTKPDNTRVEFKLRRMQRHEQFCEQDRNRRVAPMTHFFLSARRVIGHSFGQVKAISLPPRAKFAKGGPLSLLKPGINPSASVPNLDPPPARVRSRAPPRQPEGTASDPRWRDLLLLTQ